MLYGEAPREWNARRIGCDVYHLGSMVVFFVTREAMTPLMMAAQYGTAAAVKLSGSVVSTDDRDKAVRIARSYAGDREVQDHLTIQTP